ncbi:MAG: hypothetical protein HC923_12365 [Myxococcales bacterium]|nr:hypothetical protein [Myxococcales bacterium]
MGAAYHAPASAQTAFLSGRGVSRQLAATHFRPGLVGADFRAFLPDFVISGLKAALRRFDQQIRGYGSSEANLVAVESRTSSPVRVLRDDRTAQAEGIAGLHLAGEGPGYAGGIMSAALDGQRVAHLLLETHEQRVRPRDLFGS